MDTKKSPIGMAILAHMKEPAKPEEEGSEHESIAGHIIAAMKSGSAKELAEHLKNFHEVCASDNYGDNEEEGQDRD